MGTFGETSPRKENRARGIQKDIGPAISSNADVKTLHDYTIEQAQKIHSIQVRKLFTYLRADHHANYNIGYFNNPVAPFIREANVFAHGFSLAGDALALQGKRPLARTTTTGRENKTARESFIAIYRMAPEEALELVIMEVDPLFEAFLEAVYITARALQKNPSFAKTVNDKAELIKKRIVDFLKTDKIVEWMTLSETALSLDNVRSSDFVLDYTKWAADPIRTEPLAAYRNMLPATVRKLPDKKATWDDDVFYCWTATPKRAQQVENILAEYSLSIGQSIPAPPPPARAPGPGPAPALPRRPAPGTGPAPAPPGRPAPAPGPAPAQPRRPAPAPAPAPAQPRRPAAPGTVSYARAAKKKQVAQKPYDEDDSFFDDSSDGYDEEETPVNRVMNSAASSNKRRALHGFEFQHGASKRERTG
ncbi:hypothetical protein PG984_013256 [Apiospora sp. TS-2023a]